ncbi:MAG TPA: glycosyltransferase, partial [Patescibacteria group bacterium]|nr:glycosyltransferase [Patescibacteria group bacterium]
MKVILGSESFPPNISGVATATVNLAENLVKSGHEVFVFTPGKTYGNKIDPAFSKYEVYRLKSVVNPFRRGYRITFAPDWAIEKLVRKVNPDIIHLQDPAMIGQALRRVGKKLGIPVIITNHFSLEYALSYVRALNLFRPIFRTELINYLVLFYNKCDAVVTPTETFRRQIEDWGVKVPVRAISNGIEIEKFLKHYSSKKINQIQTKFHL